MKDQTPSKKLFDKQDKDNILSPIANEQGDSTKLLQMLMNEDSQKYLEKFVNNIENKHETKELSKFKEQVYNRILDKGNNPAEDKNMNGCRELRGHSEKQAKHKVGINNANNSAGNSPKKHLNNMYYSTKKEQDGLHNKGSLKKVLDDSNPDLQTLLKKKKVTIEKKITSLTPKTSHVAIEPISEEGFRKVNFNKEEEHSEKKLKSNIVHLRHTIDQQKNEIIKLNKEKLEKNRYITKLELVLEDELDKKGYKSKQANKISNYFNDKENESKVLNDHTLFKSFYIDTLTFTNRFGKIIREIENTAHGIKYLKDHPNSNSRNGILKKKESLIDNIPSIVNNNIDILKVNQNMENIVKIIKVMYQEFIVNLETKFKDLSVLKESSSNNNVVVGISNSGSGSNVGSNTTNNASKQKPIIEEFKSNKLVIANKKKMTLQNDIDYRMLHKKNTMSLKTSSSFQNKNIMNPDFNDNSDNSNINTMMKRRLGSNPKENKQNSKLDFIINDNKDSNDNTNNKDNNENAETKNIRGGQNKKRLTCITQSSNLNLLNKEMKEIKEMKESKESKESKEDKKHGVKRMTTVNSNSYTSTLGNKLNTECNTNNNNHTKETRMSTVSTISNTGPQITTSSTSVERKKVSTIIKNISNKRLSNVNI